MQSLINDDEAEFVLHFFKTLQECYPEECWREKLAVISPYAEQVQHIRSKFRALFGLGQKSPCPVDVNTIDGFQGREKDCVMVSAVRANSESHSIGFVRDKRRMNVAFTRARTNLWVCGQADVLCRNKDWGKFIEMQQANCHLIRVTQPAETFLPRYLSGWYKRHPEAAPLGSKTLLEGVDTADEPDMQGKVDFKLSEEDLKALEEAEKERAFYERDIEVVNDEFEEIANEDENDGAKAMDVEGQNEIEMNKQLDLEESAQTRKAAEATEKAASMDVDEEQVG